MELSSKLMQEAVDAFSRMPGIGKKTALRLVLFLMQQEEREVRKITDAIIALKEGIQFCERCNNIADNKLCSICSNPSRDHSAVCVVGNLRDLIAIESTHQYKGEYHILGGVISPVEGIGPENLQIESLIQKSNSGDVNEIIMALNPTIEGDTTIYYISKKIREINPEMRITTMARGIAFGGELEYTDEVTIARSLATRIPYDSYQSKND